MAKRKKLVSIAVAPDYFLHFFPVGTVIDRPGLPLLKVTDAAPMLDGNISVQFEVSNTMTRAKHTFGGSNGEDGIPF